MKRRTFLKHLGTAVSLSAVPSSLVGAFSNGIPGELVRVTQVTDGAKKPTSGITLEWAENKYMDYGWAYGLALIVAPPPGFDIPWRKGAVFSCPKRDTTPEIILDAKKYLLELLDKDIKKGKWPRNDPAVNPMLESING